MPINDVYQLDIHQTYQQNPNVYCYAYKVTLAADESAVVSDLLAHAETGIQTPLLPLHSSPVLFPCVTVKQIWPNNSLPDVSATPAVVGTRTGMAALPGQCSNVWTLYTDKTDPTPRNRGRDFWHGQDITDLDAGGDKYDAGWLAEVAAYYVALTNTHTPGSGNEYEWVMFSRTQALENVDPQFVSNGGAVPDPPTFGNAFADPIVFVRSNGLVRTQRRRQPEDPCAEFVEDDVPA